MEKERKKYSEEVTIEKSGELKAAKKFKKVSMISPYSGKQIKCQLGYETFMGPEIFFHPEIIGQDYKSLDEILDLSIVKSPLDCRTGLYKNIVLSGGSTLFKNFDKRLEQDVRKRVKERYEGLGIPDNAPEVKVTQNIVQKAAVWFGGSMLADRRDNFQKILTLRAQYEEVGPSCVRHNPVFSL